MGDEPLRVWAGTLPDLDITDRLARLSLNPIVRAYQDRRLDPEKRAARYGCLLTDYRLVDLADAEVAVMPRTWEQTPRHEALSLVDTASRHGLRTMVFSGDDLEPVIPDPSVILLHPGPTRGAQRHCDVLAVPVFNTGRFGGEARPDGDRPSVAFCGQGAARAVGELGATGVRAARVLTNRFRPEVVCPPVRGHVRLRSRALDRLATHEGVDDCFVIRDRYRAGARSEVERARSQEEFDANLASATYVLCVRGTGNFSVRFYEALSFGRIPLFVDTSCVLPLENEIDWRSRTVWVDQSDVDSIGDVLVDAHNRRRSDPALCAAELRALWADHLTQEGFFRRLVPLIRQMI